MASNKPIDKLDIYVAAQELYCILYKMQFSLSKKDRLALYPYILIESQKLSTNIALAHRVKSKQIEYLENLIGVFEGLKMTLRCMIQMNIIENDSYKVRIFSIIADIDKNLDKWFAYCSDRVNKRIMADNKIYRDK